MKEELTAEQKLESLECSKMNFENLERSYPAIKTQSFYIMAKIQLDHGLGYSNSDFDNAEAELDL